MSTGRTDEFRKEAVRIALTSGLSRRQVADGLGVGFSTINKWMGAHRGTDLVSAEDRDLARENELNRPGFVGGSNFQIGWSPYEQDDEQILS
jgi:transposase-like protein